MKHFRRILALAFALVIIASCMAFGAGTLIVSPAQNSIIDTDTLLVSVKLTEKQTVRVTVYEEKTAVKLEKPAEDGKLYEYLSVDASWFTEGDLALIADGKLKDKDDKDILLSDGETKVPKYTDMVFAEAVSYTNTKSVGLYTKQLSGLTPGLYKVKVETLAADGTVSETLFNLVAVKNKAEENADELFTDANNGAIKTAIQTIINKIFK